MLTAILVRFLAGFVPAHSKHLVIRRRFKVCTQEPFWKNGNQNVWKKALTAISEIWQNGKASDL